MAKQTIDIGSQPNDGTGDSLRDGAQKINNNFNEIYQSFGDGFNLSELNIGVLLCQDCRLRKHFLGT